MATHRKVAFLPGEYFHIYNRGNSKQKIFLDDEDRNRFIKLLYLSNTIDRIKFREQIVDANINAFDFIKGENIVSIGAYCLMPNHFHLYISPTRGVGEISLYINKICTSYSKYFNGKYKRSGSLFEGRFRAVHIEDDIQAKYLFSYIHLNPIKLITPKLKEGRISKNEKVVQFLSTYKWSSYLDYTGTKRKENLILSREKFPKYFSNIKSFNKEIFEWLKTKTMD